MQAINRAGSISLTQVSRETGIPYPTVGRIVKTLLHEGLIEREPNRKRYRATALVLSLSIGFQDHSALVTAARPHIIALCRTVAWPISIATRVGNMMMIRDSTHSLTSLSLTNYAPGYTLPIAACSTGKAYFAFCGEEERQTILSGLKLLESGPDKLSRIILTDGLVEEIRTRGYATQARSLYTADPGKTSSIAVPILNGDRLVGCMALLFFARSMKMSEAEERFVPQLRATAEAIAADL